MNSQSTAATPNRQGQIAQAQSAFLAACPAKIEALGVEPRFHLLTSSEVVSVPAMKWIVKNLIPQNGAGQLYGASMTAKTFILLSLAASVTDGKSWYGFRVNQTPVVYICLEGEEGFRQRIKALEKWRGKPLSEQLKFILQPFAINKPEEIIALAEIVPSGALVVIDTQNASAPFVDENSTKDMGGIISGAKELARKVNGFVLLVAHTGKEPGRGPRGSSAQIPAWDCCIEVVKNGNRREWITRKVKDGMDGQHFPFRLALIDLGEDEDGDRVTSCVAVPDEDAWQEEEKPLSPALNYALESLRAALEKSGADSIHVDDWRPNFYAGHTADNDNAKKVAFHRDRKKLVTLGKICVENNRYSFAAPLGTSQPRHNTVTSDAPVTSQHVTPPFKGCDDVTQCDGEARRG